MESPTPLHQNFPVGRPLAEREQSRRVMGAAAWWNFSIGVGGQVLTVREQRSKRDARAAPRAAWESVHRTTEIWWRPRERRRGESVHRTTLATRDEQSWRQVGPKNLFDRPAQGLPLPLHQNFPVGRPGGGRA
jgi:hypothetical protein